MGVSDRPLHPSLWIIAPQSPRTGFTRQCCALSSPQSIAVPAGQAPDICIGKSKWSENFVMCGRYLITTAPEAIRRLFGYLQQPNFPARYNVAPTQPIPIVRVNEGRREFALVRWGLIPAWVKDPKGVSLIIHARGES